MTESKPFCISKWAVLDAWEKVRANQGAAGVDDVTIKDFEKKLGNNLYRIWNRMSSGSYMPPPVRRVMIPKSDGKQRPLGIPTVGDRVAQMVVKQELEPKVEPLFHRDSYGYRPGKSALDAVGACRSRCWRYDWIVDLDIKGFFDNIDYRFRPRGAKNREGTLFCGFLPAISAKAAKAIVAEVRQRGIHRMSNRELSDLSRMFNAKIRGWIAYYGKFYPSALHRIFRLVNRRLVRWAQGKYKRFRTHQGRAWLWLRGIARSQPLLFAHWARGMTP